MRLKAILLLILMMPALIGCASTENDLAVKLIEYNDEKYADLPASGTVIDGVRVIEIKATKFDFDPELIIVNKGERIKLVVIAEDIPHGFEIEGYTIPEYDIDTVIRPGIPLELEFTAERMGVWEFICTIYCGFSHSEMKGTFVIR
jgi:cytochrome c oxidase subunit II